MHETGKIPIAAFMQGNMTSFPSIGGNTAGIRREYEGNTEGVRREYGGNTAGIRREYGENTERIRREYGRNTRKEDRRIQPGKKTGGDKARKEYGEKTI